MIEIAIPPEVKEIMDSPRAYVVPEEVAKVLKIDSMALRKMVRAGQIDFPFLDTGTRIRFPKLPFLRWLGYEVNGGTKNEEQRDCTPGRENQEKQPDLAEEAS